VSAKPLKSQAEKDALARKVQKWVETKVARHKFLRGGPSRVSPTVVFCLSFVSAGVVVIDAIPKRFVKVM
jgi:hypothetical protein